MSGEEHIECNVDQIVNDLLKSERDDEIAVLIFMSKFDAVLFSAVCLALGKGKYFASSRKTLAVLQGLMDRGLVRRLTITYRRRKITVYTLTDCGMRVARALSRIFGV
jgi:hypothetical protein